MIKYSVVVPCYNEAGSIPEMLGIFDGFMHNGEWELILVNNGSTDNTAFLETDMKARYPFLVWVNILENKGYGHGIYTGLSCAKGTIIGYTHADLQTDPNDVKKAIATYKELSTSTPLFIKGLRKGRSAGERIFSLGFEMLAYMILKYKLKEINAQPTLFSVTLMKHLKNPPLHWGFDLYVYIIARKNNYTIKRFDVFFPKRKHGASKWHKGFLSKINFSRKLLKYSFKLKKEIT